MPTTTGHLTDVGSIGRSSGPKKRPQGGVVAPGAPEDGNPADDKVDSGVKGAWASSSERQGSGQARTTLCDSSSHECHDSDIDDDSRKGLL